jgi:hypothetical protein
VAKHGGPRLTELCREVFQLRPCLGIQAGVHADAAAGLGSAWCVHWTVLPSHGAGAVCLGRLCRGR